MGAMTPIYYTSALKQPHHHPGGDAGADLLAAAEIKVAHVFLCKYPVGCLCMRADDNRRGDFFEAHSVGHTIVINQSPGVFVPLTSNCGFPRHTLSYPCSGRGLRLVIRFSRHARRQMKWRRVTEAEVLRVLDDPDRVEQSLDNRRNSYKLLGDRFLKVTYLAEEEDVAVITVIEKERM